MFKIHTKEKEHFNFLMPKRRAKCHGCVRMASSRKIETCCQTERDVNVTRKQAIFSSTECDVA